MADSLTVGTDTYLLASTAALFLVKYPGTTAFTGATEAEQEAALRLAFDRFEQLRWNGEPTDSAQGSQWPRMNLTDANGQTLDSGTMPAFLTQAQCWEALAIRKRIADLGADTREALQAQGVQRAKFGDIEEHYGDPRRFAGLESEQAYRLIQRYINRAPTLGNFLG
ncbi:MAG: DnaT-like ssDNA-binding protein [Armatimonadota bacterium]